MKGYHLLFAGSLLAVTAHAQILKLPAVESIVKSIKSEFKPYITYDGPTGAAASELATATGHGPVAAATPTDPPYWLAHLPRQGHAPYAPDPASYQVFRNVKNFGAKGDGVTDDTAAINAAISSGGRTGPTSRVTTTTTPAIVYFPAGTYVISSSIIDYYLTQLVGNPNSPAVIKATPGFTGFGLIDGDQYQSDGNMGWGSTNVFYRQIKHLVLDMTAIPASSAATGIHWPTAQATSIQDVAIHMSQASGTQHQGIFIENGSGGFLVNVQTTGGLYGLNVGNQQFTMRQITISNAVTGINQLWSWGWTYQNLAISNCNKAFDMASGGPSAQTVGTINIIDSSITNCPIFVNTSWTTTSQPATAGSLNLENVQLHNVPVAVHNPSGTILAGTTGSTTIAGWLQGHKYTPSGPTSYRGVYAAAPRPASLLASGSSQYYVKNKPPYAAAEASNFMSIRTAGAKGDGTTDDTAAIQNAINSAASAGKFIFFDYGVYKVTNTIHLPPNTLIVGESYPLILAAGSVFANINKPTPVLQIGKPGDSGDIEVQDMIIGTRGSTPGAVLIQYNLRAVSGAGLWDVHTRVGGFQGSDLQVSQCPVSKAPSAACEAAYMSVHITSAAQNVYMENCWLWTADHDIDSPSNTQISVFTGRGLLVEGTNVWLYGTAVEHHSLYQYQFSSSQNVVAGFIQTETPYYQPIPNAINSPYPRNAALNDPNYGASCLSGAPCDALGLRILNGHRTLIYGAGLYSFFNNYSTTCSNGGGPENCQSEIFSIEGGGSGPNGGLNILDLITIGTKNMIVINGTSRAVFSDNVNVFPDSIGYFTT